MKTIKTKLFLTFMILMLLLIGGGILLNSLFLEQYYIYKNKGNLISTSEKVKNDYINNKEDGYEDIDIIQSIDGINTIIVDENYNVEYNSLHQKSTYEEKRISKEIKNSILKNQEKLLQSSIYYVDEKENGQNTKLVFISKINNNGFIILIKSVKSIHDSVIIANEFYIFVGLAVIFVGAIFVLIFSNRITKPIIEMSRVAENISNLKFDKVVRLNSKDEIANLGNSINKISDKLCASIDELKKDVEGKKELIRNMSHELKTPIGIIKGYAEGLKYGVVNDKEKMNKYCSVLVQESDRMDNLIKELLNYSMIEGGMIALNKTNFKVYEFIYDIISRFQPIFSEENINYEFKCERDYTIYGDKNIIEKSINNFITNAINYVDERKLIKITVEKNNKKTIVNVFNTGQHIPIEEIDKIWDVYYKIDKSRARTYGGHGIGLSIVRLTAKLHNGNVKVKNVDNGVNFSIELPDF